MKYFATNTQTKEKHVFDAPDMESADWIVRALWPNSGYVIREGAFNKGGLRPVKAMKG